jgi:prepilin peptidase CpaA
LLALAHLAIGLAALTVVTVAALQDIRERLIANRLVVLLLGLGVLRHVAVAPSATDWLVIAGGALALAAGIFVVGFLIWRLGSLGGGDVKLLVAAAFFVGLDGALVLLVGTALAGGALALAYLLVPPFLPLLTVRFIGPIDLAASGAERTLPYGVAIAAGLACAVVPSLPILIG